MVVDEQQISFQVRSIVKQAEPQTQIRLFCEPFHYFYSILFLSDLNSLFSNYSVICSSFYTPISTKTHVKVDIYYLSLSLATDTQVSSVFIYLQIISIEEVFKNYSIKSFSQICFTYFTVLFRFYSISNGNLRLLIFSFP